MPTTFGIIGKVELGSNTSSITFSNIGGATHLFMAFNLKTNASTGFVNESYKISFNNSSGANQYFGIRNYAFGSTMGADDISTSVSGINEFYATYVNMNQTSPTNGFGGGQLWIANYLNTSIGKALISQSGLNATTSGNVWGSLTAGRWNSSAAITSIQLLPLNGTQFVTGSYAVLYGLKD